MSDMDIDTHPDPQPNPHHRKIDLQSTHDLTYLQDNLAKSALQKLDLHFPKISKPATHISLGDDNGPDKDDKEEEEEEEEDPMRRRVRELVSEFLSTTWRSAGHNISVNGIDATSFPVPHAATLSAPPSTTNLNPSTSSTTPADPPTEIEGVDFHYSPFDASLQHKLASLHGELEALTAKVSKLRRTAPQQGAEVYRAGLAAAMEADDARYEVEMEDARRMIKPQGLEIENVRAGWNEDVREMFGTAVEELAALAGGAQVQQAGDTGSGAGLGQGRGPTLTETVGKAQRARRVAMEME